jgi:polyphosphate kinase
MPRNIDQRVEVLVPVRDPAMIHRLREVLAVYLKDNVKARWMNSSGVYTRKKPSNGRVRVNVQELLIARRTPKKKQPEHTRPKPAS